jgi:type II secretory pathway component PulJ
MTTTILVAYMVCAILTFAIADLLNSIQKYFAKKAQLVYRESEMVRAQTMLVCRDNNIQLVEK